jgi:cardiolipin synthase
MQTAWYGLITAARQRIRLSTAYFAPDDYFARLLVEAAERGVAVDVLLPGPYIDKRVSHVASQRYEPMLLDAGARMWRYQPTMLHTKLMTVDGAIGIIGSSNFNRRSMEHDEEVSVIVYGGPVPAVLDAHFEDDLQRSLPVLPDDLGRSLGRTVADVALAPLRRFL